LTVYGAVSNVNIQDKEFIDDDDAEIVEELVLEESRLDDYITVQGDLSSLFKNKSYL
jgi:hypothetical protein